MLRRLLLIALSLTLFSWDSANAQEKKLEPLTVSYSSFTGNRAPFWIAKEIGLYEKYGLDVKLVNIAAGSVSPHGSPCWRCPPYDRFQRWRRQRRRKRRTRRHGFYQRRTAPSAGCASDDQIPGRT
jgi:hypothetical protein